MKNAIDIDVASFFRSGHKQLFWTLKEPSGNGAVNSVRQESVTDNTDLREAIKDHIDHITAAIEGKGDLMDYELTLRFDEQIEEEKKVQFTTIFNEFNTRDEPS